MANRYIQIRSDFNLLGGSFAKSGTGTTVGGRVGSSAGGGSLVSSSPDSYFRNSSLAWVSEFKILVEFVLKILRLLLCELTYLKSTRNVEFSSINDPFVCR